MANFWLPADSDLASAARGALLPPGVKPTGSLRINWSHPLARGLFSYFPMSPRYGARDIRTPSIVPTFAGGASVTPAGLSLQSADVDYVQVDRSWNLHNTSECTVVVQYVLPGVLPNDTTARIIGSDNNFVRINIRNFGGELIVRGSLFIAGSYRQTSTLNISGAVNKGDVVTFALRFDQPLLNMVGFFEGDQYNNSSQSFGAPIDDDAGGNIIFGAHESSPAEGTTGTVVACAFYGRTLSDADVESLHANPYQILKPANQTPYLVSIPAAAANEQLAQQYIPRNSDLGRALDGWPGPGVKPRGSIGVKPEISGKFNDIVAFQRSQFERSLISDFAFESQYSETTNEVDGQNGIYAYADTISKDLTRYFGATASDHPLYQATKATIVARIKPRLINGNNALFGCRVSGINPFLVGISFWADNLGANTSNTNCLSVNFQGENRLETASGSLAAGVWSTVVISFDGPAQKVCVAVDGVTKTTLDSGSVPANLGTDSDRYTFFPNMDVVTSVGGSLAFFAVSNKYAATEAECREWSRDVYGCFFQPANQAPYLISIPAAAANEQPAQQYIPRNSDLGRALDGWPGPRVKPAAPVRVDWESPFSTGLVFAEHEGNSLIRQSLPVVGINSQYKTVVNHGRVFYAPGDALNEYEKYSIDLIPDFTDQLTIAFSYRPDFQKGTIPHSNTSCTLLDTTEGNTEGVRLFYLSTKVWRFRLFTGTATNCDVVPDPFNAGDVIDLAFVYDGSSMKIYQNGVRLRLISKTGNISPVVDAWSWGQLLSNDVANESAHGAIWNRRIYNRALSDGEIARLRSNQYSHLKPANQSPYLISTSASPSGPSLSVPTVTDITQTTATLGATVAGA